MDNLFSALLASGIAGGGGGGGSYTAGDGLSINGNEISVIPATSETLGGVIIGDGLEVDESGALSVVGGSGTEYVAGQGIAFNPVGFNPDPAYYFTSKVECKLGSRTFTKFNEEPAVAFVITNSNDFSGPVYVGHTEDSVKFTQDYNYVVSDPDGSFEYQGYTWYYSHLGFFMPGSYTDALGNLQKFTAYRPSEAQMLDVYKTMIDLARAVPSDDKAISAKLGEGLSFDDNDAIKVNGLSEVQAKTVGMSEGGSNYITVGGIRVYVSSTAPTGNIPDGSVGVGW